MDSLEGAVELFSGQEEREMLGAWDLERGDEETHMLLSRTSRVGRPARSYAETWTMIWYRSWMTSLS